MNFVFVEPERPAKKGSAETAEAQLPVLVAKAETSPPRAAVLPAKPGDNRRASRKSVRLPANISDAHQSFGCTVLDMSATGARLELHPRESRRHGGDIELPQRFFLVMETLIERSVVECYVMWHRGHRAGVQFIGPIDSQIKKLPQRKPAAGKDKAKTAPISLRRR